VRDRVVQEVVLVLNPADDLLEDVLGRHDADAPAVFIRNDRNLLALRAHFAQQRDDDVSATVGARCAPWRCGDSKRPPDFACFQPTAPDEGDPARRHRGGCVSGPRDLEATAPEPFGCSLSEARDARRVQDSDPCRPCLRDR